MRASAATACGEVLRKPLKRFSVNPMDDDEPLLFIVAHFCTHSVAQRDVDAPSGAPSHDKALRFRTEGQRLFFIIK